MIVLIILNSSISLSNQKNILVTGANGQLGMEFRKIAASYPDCYFIFVTREELSIENTEEVADYFSKNDIDYCINCAAYTAVDKAETETEQAIAINATAVANLAVLCKQYNARFIHFSTDYVFSGNATAPYEPADATDPVNYYGETKLLGEQAAHKNNEESIIIRTSWVYSSFGKNFVKTMLRLMAEKESIGVVGDQWGCPTYAADLAIAVMHIIQSNKWEAGIYHYCNEGIISWYQFALAIKEISNSNCVVNAIETKDYPTPAKRPAYSALNTQKIQSVFSLNIPHWRESLERCIKLMR